MKALLAVATAVLGLNVFAAPNSTVENFINQNTARYEALFQDLHMYPEVSFKETLTAAKVAAHLRQLGFEVTENVGQTGVVGVYRNGQGPVVAIRTDMDALPMQEETGLSYSSKNAGVMHACGHDLHMAATLAVAEVLMQNRSAWHGTLVYIGQPAEEILSGAQAMINDGFNARFPRPDAILAMHTNSTPESGTVKMKPGYQMAGNDSFDLTFYGKGGHGALPHLTIDPLDLFSEFRMMLQDVISREVPALDAAVVTTGKITYGTKRNIIPDFLKAEGLVRTFNPDVRNLVMRRIGEIANAVAQLRGAQAPTLTWPEHSEVVSNDPALYENMKVVFSEQIGANNVSLSEQIMPSEDFGAFSDGGRIPSLFYYVGSRKPGTTNYINHNSKFEVDFRATFHTGVATMANGVMKLME